MQEGSSWKDTEATLDTEMKVNIISQHFAMELGLEPMKDVKLPQPKWINKQTMFCYGAYQVTIQAMDAWDQEKNSTHTFYSLDKTSIPLILGMPYLQAEGIMIDYTTSSWHWGIEAPKHKILKPKKFGKILRNEPVVYALILSNKNEDIVTSMIPCEVVNYTDVFSKENARKLPKHEGGDHAIKLNEQDSSFGSLYNLSSLKLKTLQKYLNDALVKGWIRHSTSPVGAPVLFVPKRDGGLHLCVNY